MLTIGGHNARMTKKRSKALWAVAALLVVNAVLLAAQPGLALPRSLGDYFFGPKLVRAEVVVRDAGEVRLYRVDRGRIRTIRPALGTITVLERDGTLATVPIAPDFTMRAASLKAPTNR